MINSLLGSACMPHDNLPYHTSASPNTFPSHLLSWVITPHTYIAPFQVTGLFLTMETQGELETNYGI